MLWLKEQSCHFFPYVSARKHYFGIRTAFDSVIEINRASGIISAPLPRYGLPMHGLGRRSISKTRELDIWAKADLTVKSEDPPRKSYQILVLLFKGGVVVREKQQVNSRTAAQ